MDGRCTETDRGRVALSPPVRGGDKWGGVWGDVGMWWVGEGKVVVGAGVGVGRVVLSSPCHYLQEALPSICLHNGRPCLDTVNFIVASRLFKYLLAAVCACVFVFLLCLYVKK